MNQLSGMDIHQVRQTANLFSVVADEIDGELRRLTAAIDALPWKGADRDRFVAEWRDRHVAALKRVSDGLDEAARQARRHARRQEEASSGW